MGSVGISDLSEVYGGPLELPQTFFHIFESTLQNHADEAAVIVTHQDSSTLAVLTGNSERPSTSCLTWTYRELHHAAVQLTGQLAERHNIRAGASILTFIPNGIAWPVVAWASCIGKFMSTQQDPGMLTASRAPELQNVLRRTTPDVVVVTDAEDAATIDGALSSATNAQPTVKIVLNDDHKVPTGWVTLSSFAFPLISDTNRVQIEKSAKDDDPERVYTISFTSGTTSGVPKGCPRTVASYLLTMEAQYWGASQSHHSRNAITTQNFRAIAFLVLFSTWARGGAVVIPGPGFSPAAFLDALQTHHVTMCVLIAAMLHALVAHPDFEKTDKNSLESMLLAGDTVTRSLYTKACHTFPDTEVFNGHGMTEGGNVFVWPFRGRNGNRESEVSWWADILTLGKVQRGSWLRIVDDKNQPVGRGEVGELHYNNVSFIRHYMDNVKPEDFYHDVHGRWFKSGDVGMINEEGLVWILGRKKDIIKRAGVTINPAALESFLDTFLKSQTSVIAIPHAELGQEPFAVVRGLGEKSKDDVRAEIVKVFGIDSPLGGIATLGELGLNDFPQNANHKTMKRDLEKPVADFLNVLVEEVTAKG